jgi:pimeloyl-ACP methyl ester carboxylesterase
VRWVAGDANWESLDSSLRGRIRGNGETLFGVEMGALDAYRPDDEALASVSVPAMVLVSDQSAPFFAEAAEWLAARLAVEPVRTPGTHTPQFDQPEELVATIRPFLQKLGGAARSG